MSTAFLLYMTIHLPRAFSLKIIVVLLLSLLPLAACVGAQSARFERTLASKFNLIEFVLKNASKYKGSSRRR